MVFLFSERRTTIILIVVNTTNTDPAQNSSHIGTKLVEFLINVVLFKVTFSLTKPGSSFVSSFSHLRNEFHFFF